MSAFEFDYLGYYYSFTTLAACGPRFPSTISKETSWPSSNDLNPSP